MFHLFLLLFSFSLSLQAGEVSIEEKVGQMLIVHFNGREANEEAKKLITEAHVGGFIYYNWANGLTSPLQVKNLSASLQKLATVPLFISVDNEGGRVMRLREGFTQFPSNREVAETQNPEIAYDNALKMGNELVAVGVNMNFAPVVDVNVNPKNQVIGDRSYSSSPVTVTLFARKALEGYKKSGVIATLKHFPGYGDVSVDPHEALPIVNKPMEELERVELLPFSELCQEADAIMTAHILVPAMDPSHSATLSKAILTDYLRGKLQFKGLIISDSLVMEGLLKECPSIQEASIQAILAGCDILVLGGKQLLSTQTGYELTPKDVLAIHRAIVNAVRSGRISEERIDESYERVMFYKMNYNISFKN